MEKSYTVYLTKSGEVARLIQDAHKIGVDNVVGTSCGSADDKDIVPEIYHGAGYFYCAITRETRKPGYRIEMA